MIAGCSATPLPYCYLTLSEEEYRKTDTVKIENGIVVGFRDLRVAAARAEIFLHRGAATMFWKF